MNDRAPRRMWGSRFSEPLDPDILAYTSSLSVDRRLLRWDLLGSIAHVRMLGAREIIPQSDAAAIVTGLQQLLADAEAGRLEADGPFEDVHSFIEATLYDRIGNAAGHLHTARSRNDQVVTAFRLYLKDRVIDLLAAVRDLMARVAERAAASVHVIMPGFTHLQHAQPLRLGHHLLAYFWMLSRDADRLADSFRRIDVLPLGSGAVAGVSHPIDRLQVAGALGFAAISENSVDAVGDRDFAIETVAAAAMLMVHLARWAGELVLWASEEFGFVRLADSVSHGSSIMPQKKNPDAAELVRGRAGRVIGDLTALLATVKDALLGYQSDLQEDKSLTFDALDVTEASVRAMHRLIGNVEFIPGRLAEATRTGLLTATEVADYLVRKHVPFRDAHAIAGRIVQAALAQGGQLWDLPLEVYRQASPLFDRDILDAVGVEASVDAKAAPGGTAQSAVRQQLVQADRRLAALSEWLDGAARFRSELQTLRGS
ncbi:MAG TPA: argininosuccinate lyase [bacterium]|nr:argininosuccinate lyase [bacterium]